jgi:hypothetical protein
MNRCCAVAAGDFCVVTDDDYLYPQDRVERLTTGLQSGENVVLAGTSRVVFDRIVAICASGNPYDTGRKTATEDSTFTESRA